MFLALDFSYLISTSNIGGTNPLGKYYEIYFGI